MLSCSLIEIPRLQRVMAFSMLAVVLAVPILIMRGKSATFDEVSHLPAGYSYWLHHSIEYNLQHPPLIKELCALPLLFMPVELPRVAHENEWAFGKDFLFRQDANRLLFWRRVPAVLLSLGLAILVMSWATSLWGKSAGLLAVFLYAFDPTLTAHAQLVTTDVGVAFFSTLYLWCLRSYLREASVKNILLAGVTLGLALGAKFSAMVLIPMSLLLIGIAVFSRHRSRMAQTSTHLDQSQGFQPRHKDHSHSDSWMTHAIAFLGILALASAVLWVLYFFPKDPSIYWKGIQTVNRDRGANPYFYLMGELRPGGWKYYFLIAWLVKTPIPTLLVLAWGAGIFLLGKRTCSLDEAFLIVPAAGYFAFYSFFADNIGVRYLIPCFPFLFIFASRLALAVTEAKRTQKVIFGSLLLWSFSSST